MFGILSKPIYQAVVSDISAIYEKAKRESEVAVNKILVTAYWEIGRRIAEVEQRQKDKTTYGTQFLESLSKDLTRKYGPGFSQTNLRYMRKFYTNYRIQQAPAELGWTHFQTLLAIKEKGKRSFYEYQAIKHKWSSRELSKAIRNDNVEREPIGIRDFKPEREYIIHKIGFKRGRIYTYKVISPVNIPQIPGIVIIDCGFNIWQEVPYEGQFGLRSGEMVESIKTAKEYRLRRAEVKAHEQYTYKVFVERVVDGDTIWVNVDCGFGVWTRQKLRFRGIDTPELSTHKGIKAKEFVEDSLRNSKFIIIKTHGSDKYDRYLVDIFYLPGETDKVKVAQEGRFLNQELLDHNLAGLA